MTTIPLSDIQRAMLIAQRAAIVALLPVVIERPALKAGAVQLLGALEDELGMPRTMPRREERRAERLQRMVE